MEGRQKIKFLAKLYDVYGKGLAWFKCHFNCPLLLPARKVCLACPIIPCSHFCMSAIIPFNPLMFTLVLYPRAFN